MSNTRSSAPRSVLRSAARGASRRCPACGTGALYVSFLSVGDHCPACGEALHHHRADDVAPYLALFLSLHIVVPLAFLATVVWTPPAWGYIVAFLPLAIGLTIVALPAVKGAIVGIEWALRQHGFACETVRASTPAKTAPRVRTPRT
jgi:uncharacterized protein (DUF983 family)